MLDRIDDLLEKFEKLLIVMIFATLLGFVCFNIISRNIFQESFQTLMELTPGLVLWLALMGASIGLKRNKHIKLEIFVRYLPDLGKKIAEISVGIFGLSVLGILFYCSFEMVRNEIDMFGPQGYMTLVFPIFFGVGSFRYVIMTVNSFCTQNKAEVSA